MWEWLMSSIDTGRPHDVSFAISWHGRLMVLAWGVLAPLGVIIARFFKIVPGQNWPAQTDHQFWWIGHRRAQYSAVVVTIFGIALIWQAQRTDTLTQSAWLHHLLGWAIAAFGVAQMLSGWLRGTKGGPTDPDGMGGDHYDMTARRRGFELFHKTIGYAVLIMATLTILTGLWHANAPNWMWIVVVMWWVALAIFATILAKHGMAINSYQAIWGPDPKHPGNRQR